MTIRQQEEVKRIREDYTEKTRGKYEELQSLVASIKRPPQIAAYGVGVAAALLLGFGMCIALGALSLPFAMGVSVGAAGILIAVANVFIYRAVYAARKRRYAPEVLRLTDELSAN